MGETRKHRDPFRNFVESVVQTGLLSKGYSVGAPAPGGDVDLIVSKARKETFAVQFKSVGSGQHKRSSEVRRRAGGSQMPLYYVRINSDDENVSVGPELAPVLADAFRSFEVTTVS